MREGRVRRVRMAIVGGVRCGFVDGRRVRMIRRRRKAVLLAAKKTMGMLRYQKSEAYQPWKVSV